MRIRIDLKIFIFIILFYLTRQIELYGILMIFAILHELGHLLAGVILGFKPERINIMPIGISISFKVPIENYNTKIQSANLLGIKKILIALAGPITNIIISIIFMCINLGMNETQRLNIIYANLIIYFFNLLPIYPLDGGRVLKQMIKIKYGVVNSIRYTYIIQNISMIILTIIASIAIYYLKNIAILFIVIYLWILLINENKRYMIRNKIYNYYSKRN